MIKNILFTALGLLAVIGLLGGAKIMQFVAMAKAGESMVLPPTVVSSSTVESQHWEVTLPSVGSLEAVQGVTINAEIPGRVASIHFKAGSQVKAGDLLVQQDISSEEAQLRAAEATVALTKSNLERASELYNKNVTSKLEFDTADARYKEAVAQADTIRTTIAKKTIVAPFDGKLGIRLVNLGQDLNSGDPIVSLQAFDPIFVNFYLPQRELPKLAPGQEVRLMSDAVPDKVFTGKLTAINPEVDPSTRNVRVQATLDNKKLELMPGMFASVEVVLPVEDDVLAVPVTAISYATYGDSVFIVEEQTDPETGEKKLVASQQFVQLGRTLGDYVEIEAGLDAGATVVSAGVFKLRNDAPIAINNETRPQFSLNPHPNDS